MTDVYAYWRAALAGKAGSVKPLPTIGHGGGEDPQPGLWAVKLAKNGARVPMQIWIIDGSGNVPTTWRDGMRLAGTVNGQLVDPRQLVDRWLFAEPITKEAHAHWKEHGRWPSDPDPLPPRTHNLPADPFEALKAETDDRLAQVKEWLNANAPIQGQVDCDKARNMQAELLALNKRAAAMHEAEKRPHLEAGRAVDRKYDFRRTVETWAANLRVAFEGWMQAEERRQQEAARRKYEEDRARAEAERTRIQAEHARKMRDNPVAALTDPPPELPELPLGPEPVKVQSGGGVGRKAGLKTDWSFQITDYKLAAMHVIEQPDVVAAVGKAVMRMVKAGKGKVDIPGVKVREERKVA